jgi:LysR family transcriptional regulator, regulator of abg operon
MQELLSGSVDLLLLGAPGSVAAPAKWQRLMSDPMVPLAPLSHPIHAQNKLTLTHLAQAQWLLPGPHTFTRKDFDACFERADIAPPHPALCSRSSMRDVALAQTLGLLLLLPQSIADLPQVRQDFRALRMPSQWRSRRELGFAWRADGYQNPVVKRCIKLVQQSARAHKQQA